MTATMRRGTPRARCLPGASFSRLPLANPLLGVVLLAVAATVWLRTTPRLGGQRRRTVGGALLLAAMASYANAYFAYLARVGDLVGPRPWIVGRSLAPAGVADTHVQLPPGGLIGERWSRSQCRDRGVARLCGRHWSTCPLSTSRSRRLGFRSCTCCTDRLASRSTGFEVQKLPKPVWLLRTPASP